MSITGKDPNHRSYTSMPLSQILVRLNPDVPPTGSDLGIVNAARRSYGKRSETLTDGDVSLLRFLARGMSAADYDAFMNEVAGTVCTDDATLSVDREALSDLMWHFRNTPCHDTPINHGFFSFEVKAPIFVRAQLVKHEYLILSEFSRRYITDDVEFYMHDYRNAAKNKKQGSHGEHRKNGPWQDAVLAANMRQINRYKEMIADGVAPEQARGVLPQDLMTAWTWSGTFGAFAKMCQLRLHPEAQVETRYVAEQVYAFMEEQFPVSAPLFVHGA